LWEKVVNYTLKRWEKVVINTTWPILTAVLRRKFSETLLEWKNTPKKNCLLVKGARQVGKTFIIDDFAKKNYGNYIYINFELSPGMKKAFDGDLDIDSLVRNLSARFPHVEFEPGNLLIFFDEIQSCPNARVSLKSFSLDGRFDVIASGSLLGLNYREVSSYPVGYETEIELNSLDFEEFLWALGISKDLISYVSDSVLKKKEMDESVLEKMEEYYRWHALVGGMPTAVNKFIETNNFGEVLSMQNDITAGYLKDIAKYAPLNDRSRVRDTFRSIPVHLARENKKFFYKDIEGFKPGEGSRTYDSSILWLFDAGIINFCYNLQEPSAPLVSNVRLNSFKLYMKDTGLLLSMMDLGTRVAVLDGDMRMNNGGIAENQAAEALTKKNIPLMYFEKKSRIEVGFITNLDGTVTALEVRSGKNKQSRSLDTVMSEKYNVGRGIKLETTNIFVDEKGVEHYPLFAAAFLF
jgi:predicted AAA+ superfamily ATPase